MLQRNRLFRMTASRSKIAQTVWATRTQETFTCRRARHLRCFQLKTSLKRVTFTEALKTTLPMDISKIISGRLSPPTRATTVKDTSILSIKSLLPKSQTSFLPPRLNWETMRGHRLVVPPRPLKLLEQNAFLTLLARTIRKRMTLSRGQTSSGLGCLLATPRWIL